jgi:hypothetical protein
MVSGWQSDPLTQLSCLSFWCPGVSIVPWWTLQWTVVLDPRWVGLRSQMVFKWTGVKMLIKNGLSPTTLGWNCQATARIGIGIGIYLPLWHEIARKLAELAWASEITWHSGMKLTGNCQTQNFPQKLFATLRWNCQATARISMGGRNHLPFWHKIASARVSISLTNHLPLWHEIDRQLPELAWVAEITCHSGTKLPVPESAFPSQIIGHSDTKLTGNCQN